MTPIFLNLTTSSTCDHQLTEKHHDHVFLSPCQNDSYSSCSTTFVNTTTSVDHQDRIETYNPLRDHREEKVYKHIWHEDESSDHQLFSSHSTNPKTNDRFNEIKPAIIFGVDIDHDGSNSNNNSSGLTEKWTSSKKRIMRKMMNSKNEQQKYHNHQTQQQNGTTQMNYVEDGSNGGVVRVCSSCNTTKTPLWRGGPSGPKSLCNACGIRQRKARRAMEAAVAAINETIIDSTIRDTSSSSSIKPIKKAITKETKKSRTNNYYVAQYNKKQCKLLKDHEDNIIFKNQVDDHTSSQKKLCFDNFSLNLLSKNSSLQGVFSQDEEEGAILLMTLSCGMV